MKLVKVFTVLRVAMWCRLDYPGVGPEHSFLKDIGRAEYFSVTDDEALEGKVFCELYKLHNKT